MLRSAFVCEHTIVYVDVELSRKSSNRVDCLFVYVCDVRAEDNQYYFFQCNIQIFCHCNEFTFRQIMIHFTMHCAYGFYHRRKCTRPRTIRIQKSKNCLSLPMMTIARNNYVRTSIESLICFRFVMRVFFFAIADRS